MPVLKNARHERLAQDIAEAKAISRRTVVWVAS